MPILRQPAGRGTVDALPELPPPVRENTPPAPPRHDAPATGVPSRLQARRTRSGRQTARRRGARAHQPPRAGHARPDRGRLAGHVERNRRGKPSEMADPAQGLATTTARPMPRQPFGTLADMAHPHLRAHRTARGPQAAHAPDNRRLPRKANHCCYANAATQSTWSSCASRAETRPRQST